MDNTGACGRVVVRVMHGIRQDQGVRHSASLGWASDYENLTGREPVMCKPLFCHITHMAWHSSYGRTFNKIVLLYLLTTAESDVERLQSMHTCMRGSLHLSPQLVLYFLDLNHNFYQQSLCLSQLPLCLGLHVIDLEQ